MLRHTVKESHFNYGMVVLSLTIKIRDFAVKIEKKER